MTDLSTDQPLGLIADMTRRELVHIFESLEGIKDLLVESSLLRPLDRVASMTLLQKHDCRRVIPIRDLRQAFPWDDVARRVYLLPATLNAAKMLVDHARAAPARKIAVIWVDQKNPICDEELELMGVYGQVDQFELSFGLISIEADLFSLELPLKLETEACNNAYSAALSLFQLQQLYGLIPTVYGIGPMSERTRMFLRKLYLLKGEPRASPDQPISHLFVFDRNVDRASVLLTPLTYEAMLNDEFGIVCSKVSFPEVVENRMKPPEAGGEPAPSPRKPGIYLLDNNDGVYASVRNKHITGVFPFLSAKAKEIQSTYDKGSGIAEVRDMKHFVANELKSLKQQHKQLEMHICACEVILEVNRQDFTSERMNLEHELLAGNANLDNLEKFLEDCILRRQPAWIILSLVILTSLALNGLPEKLLKMVRSHIMSSYGYEYACVFENLAQNGLLMKRPNVVTTLQQMKLREEPVRESGYPTLPFLTKKLNLVPPVEHSAGDLKNPNHMNYVFSGAYTPVCCKVVADTMVHGWNTTEMQKTFGRVFVEENSYIPADRKPDNRMRKAILVYFVGGVTYSEVAALRLLAVQNNFRIIIATTNVLRRESYIRMVGNIETAGSTVI